jgi:hypothetical protein
MISRQYANTCSMSSVGIDAALLALESLVSCLVLDIFKTFASLNAVAVYVE